MWRGRVGSVLTPRRAGGAGYTRHAVVLPVCGDSHPVRHRGVRQRVPAAELDSSRRECVAVRWLLCVHALRGVTAALSTSPQDAVWTRGSLECATPGDVYLLLKSSDLIQYDLWHAYDDCAPSGDAHDASTPLQLVLRRWSNLHPAGEFRCFVAGRELIGSVPRVAESGISLKLRSLQCLSLCLSPVGVGVLCSGVAAQLHVALPTPRGRSQ
jgi:hypothetical protein